MSRPPLSLNPRLLALLPTITAGLTDNLRVGSFWTRLNINFAVANTAQDIAHGLGRVPSGYLVIGRRQAGDVYDDGTHTNWTSGNIRLLASASGHYDLWLL